MRQIRIYQTKEKKLSGTNYAEVYKKAWKLYKKEKKRTKRRPYIRSAYFKKNKIFLPLFWQHLHEKSNLKDKTRRVKYLPCAFELIRESKIVPTSKENPNRKSEILHRFTGITSEGDIFRVQIKEDKRTGEKWLMSIFPLEN